LRIKTGGIAFANEELIWALYVDNVNTIGNVANIIQMAALKNFNRR